VLSVSVGTILRSNSLLRRLSADQEPVTPSHWCRRGRAALP